MGLWNTREDDLLEVLRPVMSTKEISDVFKTLGHDRSTEAVRKRSRKLDIHFLDYGYPATGELDREEAEAVELVLARRENQLELIELPEPLSSSQKGLRTSAIRNFQSDLTSQLKELRQSIPRFGSASTAKKKSFTTLCVLISDTHFGEVISDENGIEVFNLDIATERLISIPERIFQKIDPVEEDINEIVIFLAGDHIDGEGIFPTQAMEIETHAAQQVLRATKAHWAMIKRFREEVPSALVRVITCRGNHGRTSKLVSPEANWDNIIFQQLELLVDMEEDLQLTIKNRYGEYNTCEVKGWKAYARHNCPVQADTSAGRAKFGGWEGIHRYDFLVYGHWHHWGVHTYIDKPLFRNGSLSGSNSYAEGFGSGDSASQLAFLVTEEDLPKQIIPIRFD